MVEPPALVIDAAVKFAAARMCAKSARGAACFDPKDPGYVLALGRNGPVLGACDGSEACRASCPKICEHAEAAVLRKLENWRRGFDLVHVKVVDGDLVAGGPPSCWQCSKAILIDGRIAGVWLFRAYDNGSWWKRYPVEEFHRLTLDNCGLHIGASDG